MTVNQTGFRVDANINPFEQAMRRMVTAARDGQSGVGSAMGGLRQVTEGLRGAVMQLGAAYVGVQGAVNFVKTADQVVLLNARLKLVTGSIEAAGEAQKELYKVAQSLKVPYTELVSSFARIMPAVKELGGGVREATALSEILVSTARLSGATTQEAAASAQQFAQALGSGVLQGDELRSILENNQALGRALAQALGVSVGELRKLGSEGKLTADLVANALLGQIDNIKAQTQELPLTVGAAWIKVKNAFVLMIEEFERGTSVMASLGKMIEGLVPAMSRLTTEFSVGTKVFGGFWAALRGAGGMNPFKSVSDQVISLQKEVTSLEADLLRQQKAGSDTSGLQQALDMQRKRLEYAKEIRAIENNRLAAASAADPSNYGNEGGVRTGGTAPAPLKTLTGTGKPADKGKAAKEISQIPLYEAELAKRIETFEKAAQAEGTLRQFSRAEEAAYWKEVSTRAELSAEDKARAEKRWRDLERTLRNDAFTVEMTELEQRKQAAQNNLAQRIALAQQAHDKTVAMFGAESKEAAAAYAKVLDEKRRQAQQTLQLDDLMAQRRRDKALADVELDRMDAQHKVAMGQMTQQQLLVQQQQFEERMHAIRLQYLQQAQAAVDPERDPIRKAQIDAQIEQLELQHRQRLKGIKDQLTAQQAGPERNMFDGMQNAFSSAATDMLTRAQTLRQGLTSIYGSISSVFLQEIVSKPLAMLAARAIRESALYKMMANMAIMNQLKASGGVVAAKGGETMAVGGMNAAQAGSGTFAALAAIPVIGPALAAAAGPLMFATVMAMVSRGMGGGGSTTTTTTRIPSASGGFDIPRGLNPLTQLHEQEMVLPAHIANPLRDSLAQGGGAGQGGDAAPVVIHTTGGDFVHKRDLAKLLTTMRRDYRFQT
jgi:tape measure domain-containing protein